MPWGGEHQNRPNANSMHVRWHYGYDPLRVPQRVAQFQEILERRSNRQDLLLEGDRVRTLQS